MTSSCVCAHTQSRHVAADTEGQLPLQTELPTLTCPGRIDARAGESANSSGARVSSGVEFFSISASLPVVRFLAVEVSAASAGGKAEVEGGQGISRSLYRSNKALMKLTARLASAGETKKVSGLHNSVRKGLP